MPAGTYFPIVPEAGKCKIKSDWGLMRTRFPLDDSFWNCGDGSVGKIFGAYA